jgi:host factor-I protein
MGRPCFTLFGACDLGMRAHLDYRASGFSPEHFVMNWDGSVPRREWGRPMTPEKSQNVQDVFLNHVRKNKTPVTIFLVNGVKLQGIITWFDNFCVLLRRDAHSQLVYKHAISTVMPGQPIQLFEPNKEMAES